MTLILTIHPSWLRHGDALARVLDHVRALEQEAPYAPRPARQPGDEAEDLGRLLEGLDAPEHAPVLKPSPAPEAPATGSQLYKWACNRKALPAVNRLGKAHGFPRLVTDWSPDQVAAAFGELTSTSPPAVNGRAHR